MNQKEKIIDFIRQKEFNTKKELKDFLKQKLDIVGDYHPEEFKLEEDINELISDGIIKRKRINKGKKNIIKIFKEQK